MTQVYIIILKLQLFTSMLKVLCEGEIDNLYYFSRLDLITNRASIFHLFGFGGRQHVMLKSDCPTNFG